MPGLMLHSNATAQCTHLAPVQITPSQTRVTVMGQPVATAPSQLIVSGCPFQVPIGTGTKPQPCVLVRWSLLSARVTVMGQPVMLQPGPGTGPGICQSIEQIPQGPPTVAALQPRVTAT